MVALGAKWVRIGLDASGIFNTQAKFTADTPTYDNNFQSNVAYAHAQGLKVLVTISYNPGWLGAYHGKPNNIATWARIARRAVRDNPTVEAWEIWNEAN